MSVMPPAQDLMAPALATVITAVRLIGPFEDALGGLSDGSLLRARVIAQVAALGQGCAISSIILALCACFTAGVTQGELLGLCKACCAAAVTMLVAEACVRDYKMLCVAAVLLMPIIDALRFDFVSPAPPEPHSQYHHNILTLPRELSASQPDRSFLFHSYVDPPTTTLQRIKGITTGSLSTIIGHFLGVDHVGHRVGPDHPSMAAKLAQMDDVLRRVVQRMDEKGGDGARETSAALASHEHRLVQQIDLLPSLVLLLGLSIPPTTWAYLKEYRNSASGGERDDSSDTLSTVSDTASDTMGRIHFTRLALSSRRALYGTGSAPVPAIRPDRLQGPIVGALAPSHVRVADRMSRFFLLSSTLPSILPALAVPDSRLRKCVPGYTLLVVRRSAAALLPEVVRRAVNLISASNRGPMRLLLAYLVRGALLAGSACWVLEYLEPSASSSAEYLPLARTTIARSSLLIAIVGGGVFCWFGPLCLDVDRSADGKRVELLGFTNAVGAPAMLFVVLLGGVPLCVTMQLSVQVVVLLLRNALLTCFEVSKPEEGAPLPMVGFAECTQVALIAQLAFFGTAHQATMESIQWKAAFLLSRTLQCPWAPLLVVLTCSAQSRRNVTQRAPRSASCSTPPGVLLLGAAASTPAFRRHLMVWKVFAPRVMLACCDPLAVDLGALLGAGVGLQRVIAKMRYVFRFVPGFAEGLCI
ncbi:hypothetical protein AURDEDRAFT_170654 [Auricularia subglabra TFB-10046 SS5]|nr:hypothetical protein AURDEDRAFT_170654 [Auricularia subglabra TFB-10046 SS5]